MNSEQISAWLDGESEGRDAERVLDAVLRQPDAREACELYWLIGDALRGSACLSSSLPARVLNSLRTEPVVLAPRKSAAPMPEVSRWMPMAAAVAGVAVVVWMGLNVGGSAVPVAGQMMAARPDVPAEKTIEHAALSDEQAYHLLHQGTLSGTPMAGVAQYIRTVSDEQAGR